MATEAAAGLAPRELERHPIAVGDGCPKVVPSLRLAGVGRDLPPLAVEQSQHVVRAEAELSDVEPQERGVGMMEGMGPDSVATGSGRGGRARDGDGDRLPYLHLRQRRRELCLVRAVVTRDVPDGVFAVGKPCRVIGEIRE